MPAGEFHLHICSIVPPRGFDWLLTQQPQKQPAPQVDDTDLSKTGHVYCKSIPPSTNTHNLMMGKRQQALLGCAMLCLVFWTGVDAQVFDELAYDYWGSKDTTYCKVGGDAGWNIQQGNSTFLQNWADNSTASKCNVLVFTSAPGANHTVNVLVTSDESLTAASVCQDPLLNSMVGRNHFATNVSLIALRSNLTYWFVSGMEGDCSAGLVFRIQALSGSEVSPSASTRDLGVAYNFEHDARHPQGSGEFVPAQPAFVTGTSQRTVFYGDAINGIFSGAGQVQVLRSRGPVYCANQSGNDFSGFFTSGPLSFLSVFMSPADSYDHAIVVWIANASNSAGFTPQVCEAGTLVASVVVAQTADDCSLNPGAPYLCPPLPQAAIPPESCSGDF